MFKRDVLNNACMEMSPMSERGELKRKAKISYGKLRKKIMLILFSINN